MTIQSPASCCVTRGHGNHLLKELLIQAKFREIKLSLYHRKEGHSKRVLMVPSVLHRAQAHSSWLVTCHTGCFLGFCDVIGSQSNRWAVVGIQSPASCRVNTGDRNHLLKELL